jgi:hypothetical protein
MSPELEKKLYDAYPLIFKERNLSPQETCMCWGLECGDGWYDLIYTLCRALTYTYSTRIIIDEEDGTRLGIIPDKYYKDVSNYFYEVKCPQVVAIQVKEKYGSLRFYWKFEYTEEVISLIDSKKYPDLTVIHDKFYSYIEGVVHYAEIASTITCQDTGAIDADSDDLEFTI